MFNTTISWIIPLICMMLVPLQAKDSTVHLTNEVSFTICTAIKTIMRICCYLFGILHLVKEYKTKWCY